MSVHFNVLRESVNFQLSDVVQTIFKRPIGIADYTNIRAF